MKSDVRRKDKELRKKRLATTKKKRTTKELKEENPEVSWFLYEFFRDYVPEKFKTCLINHHLILASVYNSLFFYHNDLFKQYSDFIISFIIVHQNTKKHRKIAEASVGSRKLAEISAPSRGKWILLMKSAKESKLVSIWQIFVWGIDEWFKFKTESFHLIWSSRNSFGNNHYIKIQISHFLAIFQLTFFPRGIPQIRLRLSSW